MKMIEKLFKKEVEPYLYGKVTSINSFTKKAGVKTSSGLSLLVSYSEDLVVDDKVIIAGTDTKFVIQKIKNFIPNNSTLVKV
ncbi:MAG: hypothetical protein HQK65_14735 [Desulfamplus sp.]|nr:hypothetical protein [Desulfamplus sp.]